MALTFLRAELDKWITVSIMLEKLAHKHKVDPLTALIREKSDLEARIKEAEQRYPVSIAKHLDDIGFEQGRRRFFYKWLRDQGLCEDFEVKTPTGIIAIKNPTKLAVEQNYAINYEGNVFVEGQNEWTKEGLLILIEDFRKQ